MLDEAARALQGHAGGEEPLDRQIVQLAGDTVAVLEHRYLLRVPAALGELHRHRGLRGEALKRFGLLVGEHRPARLPDRQDDTSYAISGADGDGHGRSESGETRWTGGDALVAGDVRAGDGSRAGEGPADQAADQGKHQPACTSAWRPMASSTVRESVSAMGTATTARAAPTISVARSAISPRTSLRSLPDIRLWVVSALARSQRSRRRDSLW